MNRRKKHVAGAAVLATAVAMLVPASASAATGDLAVTKTDSPDPVAAGAVLTYTITVANLGPEAVPATLTDELDSQVDFIAATPSQVTVLPW